MRLPWAPRSTVDALLTANTSLSANLTSLLSERDFLRSQLAVALDHNRRIERKQAGLTEAPAEQKQADPVPAKIRKLAEAFGSSLTQGDQLTRARRAHADGMTWDEVEATMLAALNEGQ